MTRADGNYFQNLAAKLYQDANNIIWIQLDDYKYPRTALFLLEKFRKMALCEAHNHQFGATMMLSKHTSGSHHHITGQEFTRTYFAIPKPVSAVNKENPQRINHHHYVHFQHRTNPTSASMQIFLGPCLLLDVNTNTFCASRMPSRNMQSSLQ